MIRNMVSFPDTLTYFDVYAPFDLGTSISDDPHPILAVLNNIITRGLATNPSPFIERAFCKAGNFYAETSNNGLIEFDIIEDSRCAINNLFIALGKGIH